MLSGATLFAGDSITVGLAPFVKTAGAKLTLAEGGRDSAWLLGAMRAAERNGLLARAQNLVVLIGTNDLAGASSSSDVADRIEAIWAIGKAHGLRVLASTIPPVRGYAGFPNFAAVNARRRSINDRIVAGAPPGLVRLDVLMADPADPERLALAFDSGDHLHPRKDAHGALLSNVLGVSDGANLEPAPSYFVPGLLLVGVAALICFRKGLSE